MESGARQSEFDYIIVGAGAAATGVVYGILERHSSIGCTVLPFSIVVIERGGDDHDQRTLVPNKWHDASNTASTSVSLLQTTIGSRCIDVPIGRGLGGTTNVNACLVAPPSRDDFQSWPTPLKGKMMPSIRSIQDALLRHGTIHQFRTTIKPMLKIDAADRSEGFWRETIFPSFVTCIPMTVAPNGKGNYKRINYFDGLVAPALKEHPHLAKNITWYHHTEVQRLIFDGSHVNGVECESVGGDLFKVHAKKEVILTAGAFESPALLLTSGIGLEKDLKEANIPSRGLNLPVGHNLQDHVLVPRLFIHPFTSYDLSPSTVQAFYNVKDGDNRFQVMLTGAASYPALAAQGAASMFRRRVDLSPKWMSDTLNLILYLVFRIMRVTVRLAVAYTPAFYLLRYFCFVAIIALLNPKSNGRLSMTRRNLYSKECRRKDMDVDVHGVYLTDSSDVDAYRSAWQNIGQLCSGWFEQGVDHISIGVAPALSAALSTIL
ncbi:GMC oxidoreductase [Fragilaria crotonensis]|nr:GMC oxidoreductase [Fragilaria crotonensis]